MSNVQLGASSKQGSSLSELLLSRFLLLLRPLPLLLLLLDLFLELAALVGLFDLELFQRLVDKKNAQNCQQKMYSMD